MQVSMVMMLALTGLGCQNKAATVTEGFPVTSYQIAPPSVSSGQGGGYSTATYAGSFAQSPYPEIPSRLYARPSEDHSVNWHAELRSTLYSFVWGHDPDVSTVREIEASVYGADSEY
jgi:hypothetical protein